MRYNISRPRVAPEQPFTCEVFCFPVEAVPFMLHALKQKAERFYWDSEEDYSRGRQLMAQVGSELLMPCGTELVRSIDRVYVLLDTTLNGIQYTVTGTGTATDPYVYTPPIPDAPDLQDYVYPGMRSFAEVTEKLVHNIVDGTTLDGVTESRNFRQQLEDILTQLQQAEEGEVDYTDLITQLIALLA